jgi:hypothetical protein
MIRVTLMVAAIAWMGAAQTKAGLAPPRQIDKAARSVEQSWNGWQNSRPEQRLLDQPAAKALAAIDHSAAQAARYVADKKAYYQLIARAFQKQAQALASQADTAAETPDSRQKELARLLDQKEEISAKLTALESEHDEQAAAIKQAYQGQLKALQGLVPVARTKVDTLRTASQTATAAASERKAAAEAFANIAAALAGLVDSTDLEAEDWALYHEHLRKLVRDYSDRGASPKEHSALEDELDAIAPVHPATKKENLP